MHLFGTSNSIGPGYHSVLLFSGLESVVLLFVLLFSYSHSCEVLQELHGASIFLRLATQFLAAKQGAKVRCYSYDFIRYLSRNRSCQRWIAGCREKRASCKSAL